MNGMNMAIIITPLILWHPDPQQNCANVKAAIDVVSQLILNADKMFRIRHLKSLDYQYTTIETGFFIFYFLFFIFLFFIFLFFYFFIFYFLFFIFFYFLLIFFLSSGRNCSFWDFYLRR